MEAADGILRDILSQLEVILRRKNELEGIAMASNDTNHRDELRLDRAAQMDKNDIKQSLKLLQKWVVSFAENDLEFVCEKLHHLAMEYVVKPKREMESKAKTKAKAVPLPGTGDELENVDQYRDETSGFYMLETLHLSMVTAVCRADSQEENNVLVLKAVPNKVIAYCFDHLKYQNSVAVKHAASLCLSVISEYQLAQIVDLFTRKMGSLRGNDAVREYVVAPWPAATRVSLPSSSCAPRLTPVHPTPPGSCPL